MFIPERQLTGEELRSLLNYDPHTGLFMWRSGPRAGLLAGSDNGQGYVRIRLKQIAHMAHRLAWLYMTDTWPSGEVDHINTDSADNRWANLRDVSREHNAQNRVGVRAKPIACGVRVRYGRYCASINTAGKKVWLGSFATEEEARIAYLNAKRALHPGFIG